MSSSAGGELYRRRLLSEPNSPAASPLRFRSFSVSQLSSPRISDGLSKESPTYLLQQQVHTSEHSLFSTSSGWTDFRGFFNLAILLLVISTGRVALENLIKYGILISPQQWLNNFLAWHQTLSSWPNLTIVLLSNITIFAVFFLEKLLTNRYLNNSVAAICYTGLIMLHILLPAMFVLEINGNPLFSSFALIVIVIEVLKLISYGHVNYWCRLERDSMALRTPIRKELKKEENAEYPENLTITNMYYFMLAPTLCYELDFPRTPTRDNQFILKRASEVFLFTLVSIALCQQWVIPLVNNSLQPFSDMHVTRCIERILKLAIPNLLIWLMLFYLVFHAALNMLAEIVGFADRKFYADFWNAETISQFWKKWNIPVHRWALRHVYKPMVRNGYSRAWAALAVFLISAFFHEYLVSIPLHMFRLWAFYGMLAQIPLSLLTDKYLEGGIAGNMVVWLSLILGQPMAILMYVHDWYLLNYLDIQSFQFVLMGVAQT